MCLNPPPSATSTGCSAAGTLAGAGPRTTPAGIGVGGLADRLVHAAGAVSAPSAGVGAAETTEPLELSAEMLDAMAELIVTAGGCVGRAVVVAAVVAELAAVVEWTCAGDTADEAAGIEAVVAAADAHAAAMRGQAAGAR